MPDIRLERVEPVRIRTEATHWEQRRRRDQQQPGDRRQTPRERLLAAVLPGTTPETCEFLVDIDENGEPIGILVRDLASGRVLARMSNERLARLDAGATPGGLFVERKG